MEVVYQNNNGGEMKMKKRRSRGMHVINVALYMLRRNKRRKSLNNAGFWRRLMDSIHPLKTSTNIMMMPPLQPPPVADGGHSDRAEEQLSEVEDVFTAVGSSSFSSSAPRSRYGSAECLSEMDTHGDHYDHYNHDDDDEYAGGHDDGGDEMIDVKAEEFILRFYAQMRMQNQAYNIKC